MAKTGDDPEVLTTIGTYADDHKGEPLFLMHIGVHGSLVACIMPFWGKSVVMPPIYVDEFGDADIAMQRGQLLYLSEDNSAKVADMIISGDFMERVDE